MTILNKDGSDYSLEGKDSLKSYRPNSPEVDLFNQYDIEQIELSGSPIIYYPCFIDTSYDKVYMESIDSIIAQEGYKIYANFQPIRPTQSLTPFGIDSQDEIILNFNISQWKQLIGPMPKIKSLIYAEWDKTWWEVIQFDKEGPYRLWSKYRLQVPIHKYQGSRTDIHPNRKDSGNNSINIF